MNAPLQTPAAAWFRRHFNDDYTIIYSGRNEREAEREAAFTLRCLGLRPGDLLLDLCCGSGRHLQAFLRFGLRAAGADLSLALLRRAAALSAGRVVSADMRRLPFQGGERGFAALTSFFTSFGYFEDDTENADAAREIARVLRPGGRFLIDLMNPAPTIQGLAPRSERRAGAFAIVEERSFEAHRRRIEKRITLIDERSGEVRRYLESVRLYEEEEFRELLCASGLEVTRTFGDFGGAALRRESPRLILTGRRS
jgi:SAM-dependent methyltransferase